MKEFFQLTAFWLSVRHNILQEELPKGQDLAGAMLGLRDSEHEMILICEEIRDEKVRR